jgi:hypothetical protein
MPRPKAGASPSSRRQPTATNSDRVLNPLSVDIGAADLLQKGLLAMPSFTVVRPQSAAHGCTGYFVTV